TRSRNSAAHTSLIFGWVTTKATFRPILYVLSSVDTLKPAIGGHLKTGQRSGTRTTAVIPWRARSGQPRSGRDEWTVPKPTVYKTTADSIPVYDDEPRHF